LKAKSACKFFAIAGDPEINTDKRINNEILFMVDGIRPLSYELIIGKIDMIVSFFRNEKHPFEVTINHLTKFCTSLR